MRGPDNKPFIINTKNKKLAKCTNIRYIFNPLFWIEKDLDMMSKIIVSCFACIFSFSCYASEFNTQSLAGQMFASAASIAKSPKTEKATKDQSSKESKDMFGLKPNMTMAEVKELGVNLTPYIRYVTPTEYGVHAFYGMESYQAKNLTPIFDDIHQVILSFNNQQQLKLIQVESKVFKDQTSLNEINHRTKTIASDLARTFGEYKIGYQKANLKSETNLPIYRMKTSDLWVSVTPVIKSEKNRQFNVVYVIKYFTQK